LNETKLYHTVGSKHILFLLIFSRQTAGSGRCIPHRNCPRYVLKTEPGCAPEMVRTLSRKDKSLAADGKRKTSLVF